MPRASFILATSRFSCYFSTWRSCSGVRSVLWEVVRPQRVRVVHRSFSPADRCSATTARCTVDILRDVYTVIHRMLHQKLHLLVKGYNGDEPRHQYDSQSRSARLPYVLGSFCFRPKKLRCYLDDQVERYAREHHNRPFRHTSSTFRTSMHSLCFCFFVKASTDLLTYPESVLPMSACLPPLPAPPRSTNFGDIRPAWSLRRAFSQRQQMGGLGAGLILQQKRLEQPRRPAVRAEDASPSPDGKLPN